METIDIFDQNHNYLGTCDKKRAHEKGLWHQVFSCLFINSQKNTVYFQYKNNTHNELSTLNKVDISVGGHLQAGETIADGVREIKEESSLVVNYNDLINVGLRIINKKIKENFIIKEFAYLHIYDNEFELEKLKSIDDEVLYFIEFDINKIIDFLNGKKEYIYGKTPTGLQKFTKESFIYEYCKDDKLYLNYLLLAQKIINGDKNVKWNI